jgi:hypothetical protein
MLSRAEHLDVVDVDSTGWSSTANGRLDIGAGRPGQSLISPGMLAYRNILTEPNGLSISSFRTTSDWIVGYKRQGAERVGHHSSILAATGPSISSMSIDGAATRSTAGLCN